MPSIATCNPWTTRASQFKLSLLLLGHQLTWLLCCYKATRQSVCNQSKVSALCLAWQTNLISLGLQAVSSVLGLRTGGWCSQQQLTDLFIIIIICWLYLIFRGGKFHADDNQQSTTEPNHQGKPVSLPTSQSQTQNFRASIDHSVAPAIPSVVAILDIHGCVVLSNVYTWSALNKQQLGSWIISIVVIIILFCQQVQSTFSQPLANWLSKRQFLLHKGNDWMCVCGCARRHNGPTTASLRWQVMVARTFDADSCQLARKQQQQQQQLTGETNEPNQEGAWRTQSIKLRFKLDGCCRTCQFRKVRG